MIALDTNILVRYIVQDDKEQAAHAAQVIEQCTPQHPAFISCITLCEFHWVLAATYGVSKSDRMKTLDTILSIASFEIEQITCCIKALNAYRDGRADFSDYLIREIAQAHGFDKVITFDRNALKSEGFHAPEHIIR